ncbi:hypothetical protein X989_5237 [Burkholderia pseudomallei MSHR4378]|nr:hypothetical protein X989_5237 [Burkholderia pseudomallei MSHR4378]
MKLSPKWLNPMIQKRNRYLNQGAPSVADPADRTRGGRCDRCGMNRTELRSDGIRGGRRVKRRFYKDCWACHRVFQQIGQQPSLGNAS